MHQEQKKYIKIIAQDLFVIVTQDILWGPGIRDTMVTPYPLLRSRWLNAVPTKPVPPPEKQTVIEG
jgi:hypothetical protein